MQQTEHLNGRIGSLKGNPEGKRSIRGRVSTHFVFSQQRAAPAFKAIDRDLAGEPYFAVGITNSAPLAVVSGQRCMIDFCLV